MRLADRGKGCALTTVSRRVRPRPIRSLPAGCGRAAPRGRTRDRTIVPIQPIHARQDEQHPYRIDRVAQLPILELRVASQRRAVSIDLGRGLLGQPLVVMGCDVPLGPDCHPAVEGDETLDSCDLFV
jgi:hypothetical protein